MDRRNLLQLAAVAAPGSALAQVSTTPDWKPELFDAHQNETVIVLSELIIPATDTPGAKAALVNRWMDRLLAAGPQAQRDAFVSGLGWLDSVAMGKHSKPFTRLTEAEQVAILKEMDGGSGPGTQFFRLAKALTSRIYYSTEIGMRELNKGGRVPATLELHPLNYPESVEYLYALGNEIRTAKLGLERMTLVAAAMKNPERKFRVVHVAGTNGKGSTSAMIAAGLREAGHRVGLFTSPHLVEPTERIVVDGRAVTAEEFAEAFAAVHKASERMMEAGTLDAHPTYFETVTLMAFWWFAKAEVDWAVIEVGLGGRLDATNIVEPQLCVITPVDYDHEAWLGKSLDSIAFEKAGILKTGVPAVLAPQRAVVRDVVMKRAETVHAPVLDSAAWPVAELEMDAYGSRFLAAGMQIDCPLAGAHQVDNARTAAVALHALNLSPEQIRFGIEAARWPGRLERVSEKPEIWLDGAHNPAGARALASYIERFHAGRRVGLIYGAMRDKSVEEIAGVLFPLATELIVTAPDQTRALRPEAILEMEPHGNARIVEGVAAALGELDGCDVWFLTGSLYLVGEARALLVQ